MGFKCSGCRLDGKCHCRDQRCGFRIILRLQLTAVRFYDGADAIQTKTVMTLAYVPEGFASPILRGRLKSRFRFVESKEQSVIVDPGLRQQCAVAAIMLEGICKKLHKYFL
jgi:hypothetical protein